MEELVLFVMLTKNSMVGERLMLESNHEQIIIDTIWNQRKTDNENTKRSIEQEGQIEPGVITRDGIIIDGNRRAMCLKKIDPNGYFLAEFSQTILQKNKQQ